MDIISALRISDRPLDDDQLAAVVGADRREVHHQCRRLAFQGIIIREQVPGGTIVNRLDEPSGSADGRLYFEDKLSISR